MSSLTGQYHQKLTRIRMNVTLWWWGARSKGQLSAYIYVQCPTLGRRDECRCLPAQATELKWLAQGQPHVNKPCAELRRHFYTSFVFDPYRMPRPGFEPRLPGSEAGAPTTRPLRHLTLDILPNQTYCNIYNYKSDLLHYLNYDKTHKQQQCTKCPSTYHND